MNPSHAAVPAFLSLLFAVSPAWAADLCGRDAAELKRLFLAHSPVALTDASQPCQDLAALAEGRPFGDSDDAFAARWRSGTGVLGLDTDAASAQQSYYKGLWKGEPAHPPAPGTKGAGHPPGARLDGSKSVAVGNRIAAALAAGNQEAGGVVPGAGETMGGLHPGPATGDNSDGVVPPSGPGGSINNVAANGNVALSQPAPGPGLDNNNVPTIDTLHAMGSVEVAPAPTVAMRARSLAAWGASGTVAEDVATVKTLAGQMQLPPEAQTGLASSEAPLPEFLRWVRDVRPSDLPSIEYGILNEGEIGRYKRGLLGKGSITLNIAVRDYAPRERAPVLFHELFHYWDNEVAHLHYGNVSYGYIDHAHLPEHELDAYWLTALMWRQTKPDGANSPLAKFLDTLPADGPGVTAFVQGNLAVIKQ